jgi:hypothetical protein
MKTHTTILIITLLVSVCTAQKFEANEAAPQWPENPPDHWVRYHLAHPDQKAGFFPGDPNPAQNRIAVRQSPEGGKSYDQREYQFDLVSPTLLQVFICDGQMDVFVDGQVTLSTFAPDNGEYRVALAIKGGSATIRNPLLHYFKAMEATQKQQQKVDESSIPETP